MQASSLQQFISELMRNHPFDHFGVVFLQQELAILLPHTMHQSHEQIHVHSKASWKIVWENCWHVGKIVSV